MKYRNFVIIGGGVVVSTQGPHIKYNEAQKEYYWDLRSIHVPAFSPCRLIPQVLGFLEGLGLGKSPELTPAITTVPSEAGQMRHESS
jgi:hypothetical protein